MRRRALAAALPTLLAAGGLAAAGGAESSGTGASWTWSVPVPGDRHANLSAHELAAADDLRLLAAEQDGALHVGPLVAGEPRLESLAGAANGGAVVAYTAADASGDGQELVGVARADVDRVEVTLADGRMKELALNRWRGFAYDAESAAAATAVTAFASGDPVSALRLPQTTVRGHRVHGGGTSRYTVGNRGRRVPVKQSGAPLFEEHPHKLFLLGTSRGRAFYRIQVTARYTCWGAGKASRVGEIGTLGCPNVVGAYPLQFEDTVARGSGPGLQQRRIEYLRIGGIAVDQAATMALLDSDGEQVATTPVVDNLYSFPPPFPTEFVRVVVLDEQGRQLQPHPEWGERQTPPPNLYGPQATRVRKARLTDPVQQGSAKGIDVEVGGNGVVVFTGQSLEPGTRKLLKGRIGIGCFTIPADVRRTRRAGITTTWQRSIAFRIRGLETPFDGCEIQGTYGHRWHDQYGTHSAVEIALTGRAERYFEHRAAARDLALFVRSRRTQKIRRLTGPDLIAALRREYRDAIAVLPTAAAKAPVGVVSVWAAGSRTVFSELSRAGGRFYVELRNGKIVEENVRGLAFVF